MQFCTFVPFQERTKKPIEFQEQSPERRFSSFSFPDSDRRRRSGAALFGGAGQTAKHLGGEEERVATPRSSDDAKKLSNEEEEEVHSKRIFSSPGLRCATKRKERKRERDNNNKGLKGVTPTKTPQRQQTTILLLFPSLDR